MSQEPIYRYTPKKASNVKTADDYILQQFPGTGQQRIEMFNSSKSLLNTVYTEYQAETSQTIKHNLQEWLGSESYGTHASILMHTQSNILEFDNKNWMVASTYARECPNLKTVLRNVINRFTNRVSDTDRRLVYDFEVLASHLKTRSEDTLYIIHLEDTDVFDPQVINELITYISAYPNLPIRLVMSLGVPPRAFEERLTRETLEKMDTRLFEKQPSAEFLYRAAAALQKAGIIIGTKLQIPLEKRTQDAIFKALRYFLLQHFTSNPLATLNSTNIKEYLPLIRRLPSFRAVATTDLINDDLVLEELVKKSLESLSTGYRGFLEESIINDVELYYNVFMPNYRHALETALSEPKHYYPSEDLTNIRDRIPVCSLYSLIRASDLYLNIYDHYVTFKDTMIRPENVSEEQWPRVAAAWYQQAVTELRSLGILRPTKRKANSLEKVAYKGV